MIIVVLTALGLVPREAVLVWTGLAVFYMIFSSVQDALYLTIMSIPLFVALPVSESFDTMANWRILIAVLFLCLFFKKGISISLIKNQDGRWKIKENVKHYLVEYLSWVFLAIGTLSILVADYKTLAIKKLLFLINIFLLFLIIRNLLARVRSKESIIKIWQAAAVGGIAAVGVALIQFLVVLFVPLYNFWQFWADKVIGVLYDQNLAHLLSYSNTWFAYYSAAPPTLRLFSVFPDSHSSAMFLILAVPIFLGLAVYFSDNKRRRVFFGLAAALALFGIVFSGSRGAWLSILPVILVAFYFSFKKIAPQIIQKLMLGFLIFMALFIFSKGYPFLFYKIQSWQGGGATSTFSFFERARSISDTDELSNKSRLEIWRASAKSLLNHPFLGVGLGNYVTVLGEDIAAAKKGASAHNLYLDIATEIGIPGVLILIAIFLEILRTAWLVFHTSQEPYFKIFGLVFGLYFLWVMIYSLFDVVLLNDKVLLFFMVGVGTLYGIKGMIEKE